MTLKTKNILPRFLLGVFIMVAITAFTYALLIVETSPIYSLAFLAIAYTVIASSISLWLYLLQDKKMDKNFKKLDRKIEELKRFLRNHRRKR